MSEAVVLGAGIGILLGIFIHVYMSPVVETAHAEIVIEEPPKVVMIEVVYTKEDIIRKIKEAFPETPETALAVARCESGLVPDIQSHHTLSYGRELSWGLFQIHEPAWHKTAMRLGYDEYRTDVEDNIAMARYIYEQSGKSWRAWSCYTKKMI